MTARAKLYAKRSRGHFRGLSLHPKIPFMLADPSIPTDREKLFLLSAGAGDALDRQRCAVGFLGDFAVLLDNEAAGGFVLFQAAEQFGRHAPVGACEPSS